MGKVIDVHDPRGTIAAEQARVVAALRSLAERLERARDKLAHVLPLAAGIVADLERRLAPWLR